MATIHGAGDGTTAWGTQWADTIFVRGAAGGYGQDGDDRLVGDAAANKLVGGAGNDTLDGRDGADFLDGGAGNDVLLGGAGGDLLWGGGGNDRLDGGAGIDRLRGHDGDDAARTGDGDEATAGNGNDTVTFAPTADYTEPDENGEGPDNPRASIDGGEGFDTLRVEGGAARLGGVDAREILVSSMGDNAFAVSVGDGGTSEPMADATGIEALALDRGGPALYYDVGLPSSVSVAISATDGADLVAGGAGRETVALLGGDDLVFLSLGGDATTLGDGADTLYLDAVRLGGDGGTVADFNPAEDGVVVRNYGPGELDARVEPGVGTHLEAGDGTHVLLLGVFDATGFDFA
jgi:Ca2+-binding RTX toxin-like protein